MKRWMAWMRTLPAKRLVWASVAVLGAALVGGGGYALWSQRGPVESASADNATTEFPETKLPSSFRREVPDASRLLSPDDARAAWEAAFGNNAETSTEGPMQEPRQETAAVPVPTHPPAVLSDIADAQPLPPSPAKTDPQVTPAGMPPNPLRPESGRVVTATANEEIPPAPLPRSQAFEVGGAGPQDAVADLRAIADFQGYSSGANEGADPLRAPLSAGPMPGDDVSEPPAVSFSQEAPSALPGEAAPAPASPMPANGSEGAFPAGEQPNTAATELPAALPSVDRGDGSPVDPAMTGTNALPFGAVGNSFSNNAGSLPAETPQNSGIGAGASLLPYDTQQPAARYPDGSNVQATPKYSNPREDATMTSQPQTAPSVVPFDAGPLPGRGYAPVGAGMQDEVSGAPRSDANDEGTGRPGEVALEGPQTAQVAIQKVAPEEVQVGKPAVVKIMVRNSGAVAVRDVELHDEVPFGTRLLSTSPQASRGVAGELVWRLGTLQPGDEIIVEEQLMPTREGEIGSVATVHIGAAASMKALATKPQLVVETQAPDRVLIGDEVELVIRISNPGTGAATNVILEEHVPPQLQHPAGAELENVIGTLAPGESREVRLKLRAVRAGAVTNMLAARADGNLKVEDSQQLEILSPQLQVQIDGPAKRFLEREAAYTITIANPGTAPAQNVHLTATLPPGLKFVRANNAGSYDEASRTVHWMLAELPVRQQGQVELVVMPIEEGTQPLTASARADLGITAEQELAVNVEGIAAILFQVADTNDPVVLGGETTYEIRVRNQGTKAATNVQLLAVLPPELQPVAADGPTANHVNGNEIIFDKLSQLAPKAETTYRIRVKGVQPGDQRVRVQLLSDDIRVPVTKEESTQVYSDR